MNRNFNSKIVSIFALLLVLLFGLSGWSIFASASSLVDNYDPRINVDTSIVTTSPNFPDVGVNPDPGPSFKVVVWQTLSGVLIASFVFFIVINRNKSKNRIKISREK